MLITPTASALPVRPAPERSARVQRRLGHHERIQTLDRLLREIDPGLDDDGAGLLGAEQDAALLLADLLEDGEQLLLELVLQFCLQFVDFGLRVLLEPHAPTFIRSMSFSSWLAPLRSTACRPAAAASGCPAGPWSVLPPPPASC